MIQLINQFQTQASIAFWITLLSIIVGCGKIIDAFCSYLRRK